ncbi:MAG: type II secretion system protein [Phycisphaerales bacterium]
MVLSPRSTVRLARRAFTLVEILIVVVILGILAAIVVPQFANATQESSIQTTVYELEKLRRAMSVYQARHRNDLPPVAEGFGTWADLVADGEYLKEAPRNPYVGGDNAIYIIIAGAPDAGYQQDHGWVFDDVTGEIWAGSFDIDDQPLPRP